MNKILLRFYIVKSSELIEVIFDSRLSFIENFELLKTIKTLSFKQENYIYDLEKHVALNKEAPLSSFKLPKSKILYLL